MLAYSALKEIGTGKTQGRDWQSSYNYNAKAVLLLLRIRNKTEI